MEQSFLYFQPNQRTVRAPVYTQHDQVRVGARGDVRDPFAGKVGQLRVSLVRGAHMGSTTLDRERCIAYEDFGHFD